MASDEPTAADRDPRAHAAGRVQLERARRRVRFGYASSVLLLLGGVLALAVLHSLLIGVACIVGAVPAVWQSRRLVHVLDQLLAVVSRLEAADQAPPSRSS